ncbi:MAG: N-acetylmuramoyl-L-alanine amidase [Candidatus Hydrogenedentes bacterium]|nr:N-acetylmuramoyl-L-alanine amidase [Candidatus Hydrogenedentota bacterium]
MCSTWPIPCTVQKAFNLAIKQDLPVQAAPPVAETSLAPATPDATSEALTREPPAATSEPAPPPPPSTPPKGGEPSARAVKRPIQVVILDPGHGGVDTGCEGEGGLKESQVVLNIAVKVRNALEGGPVKVLLTREKDNEMARAERAAFASKNKGDLYIAIHLGAGLSQTGHGIEAFCYDPEQSASQAASAETKAVERPGKDYAEPSMAAAKVLIESVAAAAGQDVRGVHQAPCAILNDIDMPGLILETGYIGNPPEESLLLTNEHQDKIANGVAQGVKKLAAESGGAKP